jgi:hypothetical protein
MRWKDEFRKTYECLGWYGGENLDCGLLGYYTVKVRRDYQYFGATCCLHLHFWP